jgi:hypothetical protein
VFVVVALSVTCGVLSVLFRVPVFVLVSIAAFPAIAGAATVSPMAGEVRVGSGHGFQKIDAPTEVAAGAQVMVSPGGLASIAYAGNCVVSAYPAAITVIEKQPPCADFPAPAYFGFTQSNQEGLGSIERGTFGFTPKVEEPEPEPEPEATSSGGSSSSQSSGPTRQEPVVVQEPSHWDHSLLVVGAVVVGAGALAAILAGGGSDGPASP